MVKIEISLLSHISLTKNKRLRPLPLWSSLDLVIRVSVASDKRRRANSLTQKQGSANPSKASHGVHTSCKAAGLSSETKFPLVPIPLRRHLHGQCLAALRTCCLLLKRRPLKCPAFCCGATSVNTVSTILGGGTNCRHCLPPMPWHDLHVIFLVSLLHSHVWELVKTHDTKASFCMYVLQVMLCVDA